MPALLDTMTRERAGRGPKASRAVALSFPATIHARQKGHAGIAFRGLSRGHVVCGVVQMDHVVKACRLSYRLGLTFPPVDWRRFGRRPFPHSHWSRCSSSPVVTNRGVAKLPRVNSSAFIGSTRSRAHSLPAEQFQQSLAHRDHHQHPFAIRLPSMVQELSGRHLTNGQKRTARRSKND